MNEGVPAPWFEQESGLLHSLFESLSLASGPLSTSTGVRSPFRSRRTGGSSAVLTRERFMDLLPILPGVLCDRLFSAFDLDNSGAIDYSEFIAGLHSLAEKRLLFLYRMYDLNGDGFVSKEELLMMVTQMLIASAAGSSERAKALTEKFVAYFEELIANEDRLLDQSTFSQLIKTEPRLQDVVHAFYFSVMPSILPFYGSLSQSTVRSGWLVCKGELFLVSLQDKFLLFHKQADVRRPPMRAICLVGASILKRRTYGSEHHRSGKLVAGQQPPARIERPPKPNPGDYRYKFTLLVREQKFKFAAVTAADRTAWVDAIGDVLDGRCADFHDHYILKNEVGKGRFSTVFSAQHRQTGTNVAVKVMQRPSVIPSKKKWRKNFQRKLTALLNASLGPQKTDGLRAVAKKPDDSPEMSSTDIRNLQRTEISVLRLLNHQNIVRLLDVFQTPDFIYIIMPWSPAGDLRELLDTLLEVNRTLIQAQLNCQSQAGGQTAWPGSKDDAEAQPDLSLVTFVWIPDAVCKLLLRGILRGLTYLHSRIRNVVHRDIKPDNILLDLEVDDLLKDIIQKAETRMRQKTLDKINRAADTPAIRLSPSRDPQGKAGADWCEEDHLKPPMGALSTAVPSTMSKLRRGPGRDEEEVCSSGSSGLDTIDQYTVDTPAPPPGGSSGSGEDFVLLGFDAADSVLENLNRPSSAAEDHVNSWLFLHVLIWLLKDRRSQNFLQQLREGHVSSSAWLPWHVFRHLNPADLTSILTKHTHPRITDFGLSKILAPPESSSVSSSSSTTTTGTLSTHAVERMGTEAYAAPEVIAGRGYTTSADIWSLGVLGYQLFSNGYFPSYDGVPQCPATFAEPHRPLAPPAAAAATTTRPPDVCFAPQGMWRGVAAEAKQFVRTLLQIDPALRPSAEECLRMKFCG